MKILYLKKYELEDENQFIDIVKDGMGSQVGTDIYLQVEDAASLSLTIKGQIAEEAPMVPYACIKLADNTPETEIIANGVYAVDGASLSALELDVEGSATIYVKVLG